MDVTRVSTFPVPFGYQLRASRPSLRSVGTWLDTVRPDVVHIHHPFPLSTSALLTARRRGIRVVATNHTIPQCSLWGIRNRPVLHKLASSAFGRWIVFLLQLCDGVATPTETAARFLHELGFTGTVRAISNGVDTQRFLPGDEGPLRHTLGLDARPVVLYTGRLDAEKQMDIWLRAAARLVQRLDVQLVVGGRGSDRDRLQRLAAELQIVPCVRFIGYVEDDLLPSLYRLASIYFITSPVELQSISTLEAMASGLPIVGVMDGALPELIRPGENGYLVNSGDVTMAAEALLAILSDEAVSERMSRASRTLALRHDLAASIDQYQHFLLPAVR